MVSPAYDYAYDALWLLVASREAGEAEVVN